MGGPWRERELDARRWRTPTLPVEMRVPATESGVSDPPTGIVIGYAGAVSRLPDGAHGPQERRIAPHAINSSARRREPGECAPRMGGVVFHTLPRGLPRGPCSSSRDMTHRGLDDA